MTEPSRRERFLVHKTITVPGNFRISCDQFNGGLFFESHESFEEIWQEEQGGVRDLYKGLIQLAAAFVHISRANYVGAERLTRTALGYLAPYRAEGAMGFDVEAIGRDAESVYSRVLALGKGRIDEFVLTERPFYGFDESKLAAEAVRWGAWGFDKDGRALEMDVEIPN